MSELLGSAFDSGVGFISRSGGGGTFVAPNALNIVLTPPTGQRVRLTHLSTSGATTQASVTIDIAGTDFITAKTLKGDAPLAPAEFSIGSWQAYTSGAPPNGNYESVTGGIDEVMTISRPGALTTTVYYAYQYGE